MPIKIQGDLPVKEILEKENIFVMDESRASHQDIRPIHIHHCRWMSLSWQYRAMRQKIHP